MKRRSTLTAKISLALLLSAIAEVALCGEMAQTHRLAYGNERAARLEAITEKLLPGARVEWGSRLAVRTDSAPAAPLDIIGFQTTWKKDGSSTSVLAFELGKEKEEHIKKLERFKSTKVSTLPTTLVVARVDPSGRVTSLNRIAVDSGDPVTKIASLEVINWREGDDPVLRLLYRSYPADVDSYVVVEWDALFDTKAGAFLARIPLGILIRKDGEETSDFFAIRRTGVDQIEILGAMTKKVIKYSCSDPCVVDSSTFMKEWAGQ